MNEAEKPAPEWTPEPRVYRIIRFRQNGRPRTLRQFLTLAEAQAHCRDPRTRGVRAGVPWFDGYDLMRGYRRPGEVIP